MKIGIVVAADLNNGIGKQGKIPWRLSEDLKHFKYITTQTQFKDRQNAVIMGRLTWDSLPKSFRPLPDRLNIILTRNEALHLPEGVLKASSLETALEGLQTASLATKIDQVFIIGGGEIYKEALEKKLCQKIFFTRVFATFECDTQFPIINDDFKLASSSTKTSENDLPYQFLVFDRKNAL